MPCNMTSKLFAVLSVPAMQRFVDVWGWGPVPHLVALHYLISVPLVVPMMSRAAITRRLFVGGHDAKKLT